MSVARTLDSLFRNAVDMGEVPGVAALATDRSGLLYEGAFGARVLGQNQASGSAS